MIPKTLVVNSLGEVLVGRKHELVFGSIDVGALQNKLQREPTNRDCGREFRRQIREHLDKDACDLIENIWRLQKMNNARFRVWLGNSKPFITTEFITFVDNKAIWREVSAAAKRLKIKPFKMREEPHLDKSKKVGAKRWHCGPNHGRMERQVSFDIPIEGNLKKSKVKRMMKQIARETETIWKMHGVNVV